MEEQKTSSPALATSIKWGLIGGIVLILASLIFTMRLIQRAESGEGSFDMKGMMLMFVVSAVIIAITLVLGQKEHRNKDLGGYMSYGRAIGVALIAGFSAGVLTALYNYMLYAFIKPELIEIEVQMAQNMIYEYVPEGNQEEALEKIKASTPLKQALSVLWTVPLSFLIVGLFTSIGTKRNPPELS